MDCRDLLTVGMAVHTDFSGVWFTLNALRIYHPPVRFVVVDNAPQPCRQTEGITLAAGGKYVHRPDLNGTSKPRAHVFDLAETPWVCCVDCHVLFVPGAVEALATYALTHPQSKDVIAGPMWSDSGHVYGTHWQADSTCGLWGTWAHDPRGDDPAGAAFEIPMQGLGLFMMRKAAWPGFNHLFTGFGGEEGYLHEKVRQRGGKALCLPAAGWYHRFRDGGGGQHDVPYRLALEDHAWNLLVGHRELGIEATDKIYQHFGKRLPSWQWEQLKADAEKAQPFGEWARLDLPLEREYTRRCREESVINEHLPTLRRLAEQAREVVEFGTEEARSTTALLAGRPERFRCYDRAESSSGRRVVEMAAPETKWASFEVADDLTLPPQPCDLLFIDTHHTGPHLAQELALHAPACRRRIALHDTEIFGERGENDEPGLRHALRDFLKANPEWFVSEHHENNCGLTVLSRDPEDPRAYPKWLGAGLIPQLRVLGIWYTNNKAPLKLMQASLRSIARAQRSSRHDVFVSMCSWEMIEGNPFVGTDLPHVFVGAEEKNGNHLTITRQMQRAVEAVKCFGWDVVCFLEHDTLYPEDYFDRVADAFLAHPGCTVVSNLDYEGLNATGFLAVRERHEPMHQLSLRRDFALANLDRCLKHFAAGTPDTLLEPDSGPRGDRSKWVRLPPLGEKPSLHVNFKGRFTSHGEVVYYQHSYGKVVHRYWGRAEDLWDGPLEESEPPPVAARVPAQGQRGCPDCPRGQHHWDPTPISNIYERERLRSENIAHHMPQLLTLAFKAESVACLTCWHDGAFIALAAALPKRMYAACPGGHPDWAAIQQRSVSPRPDELTTFNGDPLDKPIHRRIQGYKGDEDQPYDVDLLFLSCRHQAEYVKRVLDMHGPHARKWIALHNTVTYGETGDDGGPGILAGVRAWLRENPEWSVRSHDRANNGLLVMTRDPADKKPLPPFWKQAFNALKAGWRAGENVAGKYGPLAGTARHEERLALCVLCPSKTNGDCAECGCPVEQKTSWPAEACPLGAWGAVDAEAPTPQTV